jgi:hypothetical protein
LVLARLGHLGQEVAGTERVHPDVPSPRPLLREVARQAEHARLAGRVRGLREPRRDESEHARDVHDGGVGRHDRRAGLRHPEDAVEVDVDDAPELLRRLPHRRARRTYPRVVHEAVNLPELGDREIHERGAGVRIGDVGRLTAHFGALRPELAG